MPRYDADQYHAADAVRGFPYSIVVSKDNRIARTYQELARVGLKKLYAATIGEPINGIRVQDLKVFFYTKNDDAGAQMTHLEFDKVVEDMKYGRIPFHNPALQFLRFNTHEEYMQALAVHLYPLCKRADERYIEPRLLERRRQRWRDARFGAPPVEDEGYGEGPDNDEDGDGPPGNGSGGGGGGAGGPGPGNGGPGAGGPGGGNPGDGGPGSGPDGNPMPHFGSHGSDSDDDSDSANSGDGGGAMIQHGFENTTGRSSPLFEPQEARLPLTPKRESQRSELRSAFRTPKERFRVRPVGMSASPLRRPRATFRFSPHGSYASRHNRYGDEGEDDSIFTSAQHQPKHNAMGLQSDRTATRDSIDADDRRSDFQWWRRDGFARLSPPARILTFGMEKSQEIKSEVPDRDNEITVISESHNKLNLERDGLEEIHTGMHGSKDDPIVL